MVEAQAVVEMMIQRGEKPNEFTNSSLIYSILINGYCKSKRMDDAMRLFEQMSHKGLIPNVIRYNTLIGGFFQLARPRDAHMLLNEMRARGQKPLQRPKS
ncbi:hypothetical protein L1049_013762 [Liquidambar formosana]|uniref:Pentatricopeptide repeat-containing protein n=1 Tax=Liquidambar formosana TaxID=63359 RepID=A0AAP0RL22_LIQFO